MDELPSLSLEEIADSPPIEPLSESLELVDLDFEAPLDASSPAAESDWSLDFETTENLADWDETQFEGMDLPHVELPSVAIEPEVPAATEDKPLTLAEVLATPTQAINPPAHDVPPSLLPPPADEEPVDDELLEVFVEEVGEVLETIGEYLPQWRSNTENKDALIEVRRAFHTLKGSGRMVRALVIGELGWSIENLLNRVLERSIQPGDEVQQVIVDVVALMPALVDEFAAKAQRQRDDVDFLAATAHALAKGQTLPKPDAPVFEQAAAPVGGSPAAPVEEEEVLDPQLLEIFRNEAETHLETLVGFLADCAQELPQPVTDDLQRALHTLKGSAYMAGILPIAEIAAPLEKLAKEFKANLIPMDLAEAELLQCAEQLFRIGLEQLDSHPLAAIPGAEELFERVQRLHAERLETAELARQDDSGESRDPQLIGIFLAEGMDILLDAEGLLRRWQEHPSERQELSALLDELTTLGRGAEMAELPQIDELCQALLGLYGAVQEGRLAVSQRFFEEADKAHETLIDMMDQVAAGLQVTAQPDQVEALNALLDEAFDPATLALLEPDAGFDVVELELDESNASWTGSMPADQTPEPVAEAEAAQSSSESEPVLHAPSLPATVPVSQAYEALDDEMVDIFLEEAVDILDSAGQSLERWLGEPDNTRALLSLQRDLHTLKGGARMAEIKPIGDLAHELEFLYEGLVDRRYSYSPVLAGLLHQSHDRLATQLDQLQSRQPMVEAPELIDAILAFRQGGAGDFPEAASPRTEWREPADLESASEDDTQWASPLSPETLVDDPQVASAIPEAAPVDDELPGIVELASEPLDEPPLDPVLLDELPPSEAPGPDQAQPAPSFVEWGEPAVADEETFDPAALVDPEFAVELEPAAPEAPSPATPNAFDDDRDPELVEIFLEEGFDIIDSSSAALQRWMEDTHNTLEVESLQRDLHTLKGGARMAEIREIGDLAHELEFLYEGLGDGRLRASPVLFDLLQACHDRLALMLEAVRDKRGVPDGEALIETIKRFCGNPDEQLSMPASVSLSPSLPPEHEAEEDILEIFLEEGDELLEAMDDTIGRWEANRDDSGAALAETLRILHTLKGGARLSGQKRLGDLSHELEQHLTEALQRGAPWPDSLFLDVRSGFDGLQNELDLLRQRLLQVPSDAPVADDEPQSEALAQPMAPVAPFVPASSKLLSPIVAASDVQAEALVAKVLPFVRRAQEAALDVASRRAPQELVKVPAELLEGLVNLAGETSIFRGRVEQQVSDFGFTLGEMEATIDRVRDQLRRLDIETQSQILSRYQAEAERAGYEDFDPLEMDRHSQLQQLSRALFESASDLLDLKETLTARNRDAETLLLQQARVNTELQEGLMRTRLVPFDRLVPRLRRIVRQVAGELGKQVDFVVGNADGEMDRTVLERIVAPLEHMLRNAVDHGIERGEVRRAAGKSEQGTIRLDIGREGGDIVLTLSDDGGGVRLDAVRRKAIERGMMDQDSDLTDHEILQFILDAGFSTAEKVTQISGRGVGMDVVHSEVKQLGGSMSIESTPGQGTRFRIRLPFTVSVNRALMVLSGEDLYAIPLNTIEGIVRVSPYELEALYEQAESSAGQGETPHFEYAGQAYELRYLGDLLNNGQHPKLVGQSLPLPVILVRSTEHAVAVQVDSLAGSREIVVKSLGPQFAGVHGVSGATILGDGRVVIILDLLATIRVLHAHLLSQLQPRLLRRAESAAEAEAERPTLVMVVDDSVTVRKVTTRLLERNGMNVLTAKDGVDAITQLQEHKPDIMLLDIEMPRMDGFEVANLVRHDERLKDLPIIMITSRTGEKHRDRAMSIGVNEYLGKPYQESLLLETIAQLVDRHPVKPL